ncbi:MAG: tyrosine-type recombinase/integrase [Melioribacteraceae bacterium]|nr:tyrosine-type recombinase/integrase [Melioribacteraceae bacterium]
MQNKELLQLAADLLQRLSCDKNLKLEEFANEYIGYLTGTHSRSYIRGNRTAFNQLQSYLGNIYLKQLNVKAVDTFINSTYQRSPQAAATYYRVLKAALNKAVQWNYLIDNPFTKIKAPKIRKNLPIFISQTELNIILDFVSEDYLKNLYLFAFHTGLRAGEIVNLKWCSVSLSERIITLKQSNTYTTKNRKERIIPINSTVYQLLNEIYPIESQVDKILGYSNNKLKADYIFYRIREVKLRTDFVSKKFKRAVRKAGLNDQIHFHTLRHSFASNLVQKGVSLYVIKELLGHSDFRVTQIYSHLQHSNLKKAVEKLTITNNNGGYSE